MLVRLASLGAPRSERGRMRTEWEAEIAHEDVEPGWTVVRTAVGAFADARALRTLEHGQREGTMGTWVSGWTRDLRVAARGLLRAPAFSATAVVTLALGMGGSAAIWSLLDRIVLDPLPYPEPERLVQLENQVPGLEPGAVWNLSTAQYVYFTDHLTSVSALGLYRGEGGNVTTPSGPMRARSVVVTATMMDLLGARALAGRLITPEDDTPGASAVALISEGFWERVLGRDPGAVGRTLSLNDEPVEIIGVLDGLVELPGFEVGELPDLWLPMRVDRAGPFWNSHVYPAMARLAPDATPATVEVELERLTARLPESFPNAYSQSFFDRYGFRTQAVPLKQAVLGDMADNLWILLGAVGLVMLIACANVANLFVVRMDGRSHELGIRAALGASRPAIARYLLLEGLTLSLAGGVAGTVLGAWALPTLARMAPTGVPRIHRAGIGAGTIGVMLALSLAVGLLLTAWPLLTQGRRGARGALVGSARGASVGRERQALRSALVIAQVALALTLVVGAGLLVRTLQSLHATELGFEPAGVLAADIYLSPQRYPDDAAVWGFYREALDRIRALPGVAAAGFGEQVPVEGGFGCTVQGFEDETVYQKVKDAGMTTCAGEMAVTPGYLEALGIPLLEGRGLEDGDNDEPGRAAVVVSRAFAERFWPGREPLGQGVAPGGRTRGPFYHAVGVAGDVPKSSTEAAAPLSQVAIAIYYPMIYDPNVQGRWGWWPGTGTLVVRSGAADPTALFGSIRRIVSEVDTEVPLANLRSMDDVVARANAKIAFVSVLLAIAAAVALALASVGLYGVISFVVGRRTREIGMRLAVGADPGRVLRMVVGRSLGLVTAGLAIGVLLALGSARVLRGLLVGVAATDPLSYALASGLLAAVALLATWLPARRAARVDPVEALRAE